MPEPTTPAPHERIIIPLDVDDMEAAEELVRTLRPVVGMFKIGKQLFTAAGPAAVDRVHGLGGRVFLDLKWHDIPNTVAAACRIASGLGVAMMNVHASGGRGMLCAAREAVDRTAATARPLLLAVTVLTSLGDQELPAVGVEGTAASQVARLAALAIGCGMDGFISSPREVAGLRSAHGMRPTIAVPGVRPTWAAHNDQQRVATPADAVAAGADYLIVGRPITAASDPRSAAERVAAELEQERT